MGTVRRYGGFTEEENFNPAVPPEAKFHIEIASATLDVPANPNVEFESGLYRGRREIRPGYYTPSGNIVFPINVRAIGYFLKWALGEYKFTDGGAGTNTHEIYGKEGTSLPSFTARIGKDHFEHIFTGTTINSLQLEIGGDWLLCTVDCVAGKDHKGTLKEIADLDLFEEKMLTFIAAGVSFGGVGYNCKIKNMTINIANNIDAPGGKGIGTRYPCRFPVGARNVNLSGNLHFEDETEYAKYWGDADGIHDTDSPGSEEIIITIDGGTPGSLELKFPKVQYTQVGAPPSGRSPIDHSFSAYAIVDTTTLADAVTEVDTEMLATLENNNDDMDEDIES